MKVKIQDKQDAAAQLQSNMGEYYDRMGEHVKCYAGGVQAKLVEMYEDQKKIYFVNEMCLGGTLYERVAME